MQSSGASALIKALRQAVVVNLRKYFDSPVECFERSNLIPASKTPNVGAALECGERSARLTESKNWNYKD